MEKNNNPFTMGTNGEGKSMRLITPEGHLDGPAPKGKEILPCTLHGEMVGAFLDPPPLCITDVHRRTLALLEKGRVLVIYIDGLGYDLYRRAPLPFIRETFCCTAARSVFPPLTQPCMASMLTGALPDAHGICSRRDHRPGIPSLMKVPGSVLVEADSAPLCLEQPPVLTVPEPGETVDAAVLRAALPLAAGDAPLLIVHFHGLDDAEHDVGDDAIRLAGKLHEIDDAVRALCAAFTGTAILCADHGVHAEDGAGTHGSFDYRDMFVPYGEATLCRD